MFMKRFLLDHQYPTLLESMGISTIEVLRKAQLPDNLFGHANPSLSIPEYFRLMEAIDALSPDELAAIKISQVEGIETFSPPIFAAYCSQNVLTCMERIARYKQITCPLILQIEHCQDTVSLEITLEEKEHELPTFLVVAELTFLINLIRKATKEHIVPASITMRQVSNPKIYADYFGIEPTIGSQNKLTLRLEDALKPFITRNDTMWDFFEPELKRRLDEIEMDASFSARVRTALTELLPSGHSSIEDVAKKLGYTKRTFQRKLNEEGTTFQKQLNHTRELLAKHYLVNSDMSNDDITYLLGYQDLNSFFRSFHAWTGMTVNEFKRRNQV